MHGRVCGYAGRCVTGGPTRTARCRRSTDSQTTSSYRSPAPPDPRHPLRHRNEGELFKNLKGRKSVTFSFAVEKKTYNILVFFLNTGGGGGGVGGD